MQFLYLLMAIFMHLPYVHGGYNSGTIIYELNNPTTSNLASLQRSEPSPIRVIPGSSVTELEINQTIFIGQKQACCLDVTDSSPFKNIYTLPLNPCIGVAAMQPNNPKIFLAHVDSMTSFESVAPSIHQMLKPLPSVPITIQCVSTYNKNKKESPAYYEEDDLAVQRFLYNFESQEERVVKLAEQINQYAAKNSIAIQSIKAILNHHETMAMSRLSLGISQHGTYVYSDLSHQLFKHGCLSDYLRNQECHDNFCLDITNQGNLSWTECIIQPSNNPEEPISHDLYHLDQVNHYYITPLAGTDTRIWPRNHWPFRVKPPQASHVMTKILP